MRAAWGAVVAVLALVGWGGQLLSALAPDFAVRLSLMEAEEDVEPLYWADIRAEARWDALTLWAMVVAGILLIFDADAWAYFGLVGGGMYLYFAGRGVFTRQLMRAENHRIGAPESVQTAFRFLTLWAAMALATIVLAVVDLERTL